MDICPLFCKQLPNLDMDNPMIGPPLVKVGRQKQTTLDWDLNAKESKTSMLDNQMAGSERIS